MKREGFGYGNGEILTIPIGGTVGIPTAGLLVHNENDIGILGSLPLIINKNLLSSWIPIALDPQDLLLDRIGNLMPNVALVEIDSDLKIKIAEVIRKFYLEFPSALNNQAIMPS